MLLLILEFLALQSDWNRSKLINILFRRYLINTRSYMCLKHAFLKTTSAQVIPRKDLFLNTTWISKRCSIFYVKKCLARCVPTYSPNHWKISHVYTVSVCTAWNNGTQRAIAMAATPSDVQNVKPLAEFLRVAIWKIFLPVFIWMAWLMCWQ